MIKDYSNVIELNNATLEDCVNLFENESMFTIINDGRIVNFEKE